MEGESGFLAMTLEPGLAVQLMRIALIRYPLIIGNGDGRRVPDP